METLKMLIAQLKEHGDSEGPYWSYNPKAKK